MLSKAVLSFVRNDIYKMSNLPGISAGWVTSKTDLSDIYKLRYNVMVRDVKQNPFPANHYCIHGDEFRDTYDELPSTSHYLVRKNGVAVAAHRLVNGNHTPFEIEKHKWFPLSEYTTKMHKMPQKYCGAHTRCCVSLHSWTALHDYDAYSIAAKSPRRKI